MPLLLTFQCRCEKTWVEEHETLVRQQCPQCGCYPVFPIRDEDVAGTARLEPGEGAFEDGIDLDNE